MPLRSLLSILPLPATPAGKVFWLLLFFQGNNAAASIPPDTTAERVLACVVCHGKEGRATNDGYYPRIAGKPAGYLYNQLVNFRDGRRHNATMVYLVDNQSDAFLREIADYFAGLMLPYPPPQAARAPAEVMERGRQLVLHGDKAKKIPPCIACHGKVLTGTLPATPGLLGLPHAYLYAQLSSWKGGSRRALSPDCMADIARNMSMDDISATTTWLASRPVPARSGPARTLPEKAPLECGSIPDSGGRL